MTPIKNKIRKFIDNLAQVKLPPNAYNQYGYDNRFNTSRRRNLLLYLDHMGKLDTNVLFVGEAPGYRGCRLTGVPFTSEFILMQGIDKFDLFGLSRGYKKSKDYESIQKEASSTIVWNSLVNLRSVPLLWNAFPYHSFKEGYQYSNRTPSPYEIEIGQTYLIDLINIFNIRKVVAIGNKAASALTNMGIPFKKVRHPSKGGKKEFQKGINLIQRDYEDIN